LKKLSTLLSSHVKKRPGSYGLIILMVFAGMVAGIICTRFVSPSAQDEIREVLSAFFTQTDQNLITPSTEEIISTFLNEELLHTVAAIWVLGLTVIGVPLVLGILFFKGFALGFTAAFLIKEYLWTGVLLVMTVLIPKNLLALVGLLMAGAMSLWFAGGVVRILTGRKNNYSIVRQLASATFFTVIAGVLVFFSSLVESYLSPVLLNMLSRYF
jgi:stage II sporulation protein M